MFGDQDESVKLFGSLIKSVKCLVTAIKASDSA